MNTIINSHIKALERLPSKKEKIAYLIRLEKSSSATVDSVIEHMKCTIKKEMINIIFLYFLQKQIFKTVCLDVAKKEGWSDSVDLIELIYFDNLKENISSYSASFFKQTYTKIRSIFSSISEFTVKYLTLVCEAKRYDLADIILSNTKAIVIDLLVTHEFSFSSEITAVQRYFINKYDTRYTFKVHPILKKIIAITN